MPSQDRISPSDLAVRVLEQTDDLSTFDCSRNDIMGLNEFIHSEAKQFQKEGLGVTHLFFYNDEIVGFATLSMSQIEIKYARYILPLQVKIKYYPALQIGRLAIDNRYRDRGLGKSICLWCLSLAQKISKKIGCRLVTVLTEGEPVKFYEKCSFKIFPRFEKKRRKWMYLQVPRE